MEKVIVRSKVYTQLQDCIPELCYYGPKRLHSIIRGLYKNGFKMPSFKENKFRLRSLHRASGTKLEFLCVKENNIIYITSVITDQDGETKQKPTVNTTRVFRKI